MNISSASSTWSITIGQTPVTSPAVDLSIRSVVHCRWVEISITGATGKTPLVPVLMMIPMRRRMIITIPMMGMHDDKFSFFRRPPCLPTCSSKEWPFISLAFSDTLTCFHGNHLVTQTLTPTCWWLKIWCQFFGRYLLAPPLRSLRRWQLTHRAKELPPEFSQIYLSTFPLKKISITFNLWAILHTSYLSQLAVV